MYVTTSSGSIVPVPASYDKEKDIWLATRKFYSEALPTNLSVDYKAETKMELDHEHLMEVRTEYEETSRQFQEQIQLMDSIFSLGYESMKQDSLLLALGIETNEDVAFDEVAYQKYLDGLTDEELNALIEENPIDGSEVLDSLKNEMQRLEGIFTSEIPC